MNRVSQMEAVQKEGLELFKRKNNDYGDAFANYGPVGVIVRMGDKINRLMSITKTGVTMVNDEGLRDTLIDLYNYSAMAIMLMDEKKMINIYIMKAEQVLKQLFYSKNLPNIIEKYSSVSGDKKKSLLEFINNSSDDDFENMADSLWTRT